ncbi:MAG: hydrogenase maturation protease [Candidatus Hydrogenedentota bacterium]
MKKRAPNASGTAGLVIGWGNELLGDDAAGRRVAQALEAEGAPGVEVVDIHQLTPELALRIAETHRVIFVDACSTVKDGAIRVEPIYAGEGNDQPGVGHTGRPQDLLAMAAALYEAHPEAWLIAVPARSFEACEALSDTAEAGVRDAVEAAKRLLARGPVSG